MKIRGVFINNYYMVDNLVLVYVLFNFEKGVELLGFDIFCYYFFMLLVDREIFGVFLGIKSCFDCYYLIFDLFFRWDLNFKIG